MKRQPDPLQKRPPSFSRSLVTLCSSRSSSASFLLLPLSLSLSPSHSLPLSRIEFRIVLSRKVRSRSLSHHFHTLLESVSFPLPSPLPSPRPTLELDPAARVSLARPPHPDSLLSALHIEYKFWARGPRGGVGGTPAKDLPAVHLKTRLVARCMRAGGGSGVRVGEGAARNGRIRLLFLFVPRVDSTRVREKKKKDF